VAFIKPWQCMSTERRCAAVPIVTTRGRCCLILVLLLLSLLGKEALKRLSPWNECHSQTRTLKEPEKNHYACYWHGTDSKKHSSEANKNFTAKHIHAHWLTCAFWTQHWSTLCINNTVPQTRRDSGKRDFGNSPPISVWHARGRGVWLNSIF